MKRTENDVNTKRRGCVLCMFGEFCWCCQLSDRTVVTIITIHTHRTHRTTLLQWPGSRFGAEQKWRENKNDDAKKRQITRKWTSTWASTTICHSIWWRANTHKYNMKYSAYTAFVLCFFLFRAAHYTIYDMVLVIEGILFGHPWYWLNCIYKYSYVFSHWPSNYRTHCSCAHVHLHRCQFEFSSFGWVVFVFIWCGIAMLSFCTSLHIHRKV